MKPRQTRPEFPVHVLTFRFSPAEMERINRAANRAGLLIEDWSRRALLKASDESGDDDGAEILRGPWPED